MPISRNTIWVTALAIGLACAAGAQSAERLNGDARDRTSGQGPSVARTQLVVDLLSDEFARCSGIAPAYRTDCYKWVYRQVWQAVDGNRAYRTAQTVFEHLDREIGGFVRDNTDWSQGIKLHGFQIYRATAPGTDDAATQLIAQALSGAVTDLRQAPEQVGTDYARISDAVAANADSLR